MNRTILLLRGVNVGGVKLPMADFRTQIAGIGLQNVRSYIQSGNILYDDPGISDPLGQIADVLKRTFGLAPALFAYSPQDFDVIAQECPYAAEGHAGAKVHIFFLAAPVAVRFEELQALATTERFSLSPRAFYLHAPEGVGRSALVEKLPRLLKTEMTARNWNTVQALSEMAKTP